VWRRREVGGGGGGGKAGEESVTRNGKCGNTREKGEGMRSNWIGIECG